MTLKQKELRRAELHEQFTDDAVAWLAARENNKTAQDCILSRPSSTVEVSAPTTCAVAQPTAEAGCSVALAATSQA